MSEQPSREAVLSRIPRLFKRLQAIYGSKISAGFGDVDNAELVATWERGLAQFDGVDMMAAIDALLTAHPTFPPTLGEFRALCYDSRHRRNQTAAKLPPPRGPVELTPELAAEIAKLTDPDRKRDPRDWARRILANPPGYPAVSVEAARESLGVTA